MTRQSAAFVAVMAAGVLSFAHPRAAAQVCDYHVSPVWNDIAAAGQTGTITIDTQPGCAWTATVTDTWIAVDTLSGNGQGAINYTAAASGQAALRQARIKVRWDAPTLGQDVVLTQQNGPCPAHFNMPSTSMRTFGALAGSSVINVDSTTAGAWWRMTTDANWITMSTPSGIISQGGQDFFGVAANPSPELRVASITGCDGQTFTIRQAGLTPAAGHYVPGDFDGDGKADIAIYRPTQSSSHPGGWFVLLSSTDYSYAGALAVGFGGAGTAALTGDFDGDGRSEMVMFDPCCIDGHLAIRYSSDAFGPETAGGTQWNDGGVEPIAADFDGRGTSQLVLHDPYRGEWTWWTQPSPLAPRQPVYEKWGRYGDVPVLADYDGDGKADLAVWRPLEGRWYVLQSSTGYDYAQARAYQWGAIGDTPVVGDYDGDGRPDLAVWRPSNGTWYINPSSGNYDPASAFSVQWGSASDVPVPADYDGDGRMDLAVWRPSTGTWYLLLSSSHYAYGSARSIQWGRDAASRFLADQPVGGFRCRR